MAYFWLVEFRVKEMDKNLQLTFEDLECEQKWKLFLKLVALEQNVEATI